MKRVEVLRPNGEIEVWLASDLGRGKEGEYSLEVGEDAQGDLRLWKVERGDKYVPSRSPHPWNGDRYRVISRTPVTCYAAGLWADWRQVE